jgi:hypothetical protein
MLGSWLFAAPASRYSLRAVRDKALDVEGASGELDPPTRRKRSASPNYRLERPRSAKCLARCCGWRPLNLVVRGKLGPLTRSNVVYTLRICASSGTKGSGGRIFEFTASTFVTPRPIRRCDVHHRGRPFRLRRTPLHDAWLPWRTPVSIVHTETPSVIRIISFRKATPYEEGILYQSLKN